MGYGGVYVNECEKILINLPADFGGKCEEHTWCTCRLGERHGSAVGRDGQMEKQDRTSEWQELVQIKN